MQFYIIQGFCNLGITAILTPKNRWTTIVYHMNFMISSRRSRQLRKATAKSRSGSLNQDPVEVFCRVRPLKPGSVSCLKVVSSTTVQLTPPESATSYRNGNNCKEVQHTFKEVFGESAAQRDVFENVALYLVKQLVSGKNGLLFTYGVTGLYCYCGLVLIHKGIYRQWQNIHYDGQE